MRDPYRSKLFLDRLLQSVDFGDIKNAPENLLELLQKSLLFASILTYLVCALVFIPRIALYSLMMLKQNEMKFAKLVYYFRVISSLALLILLFALITETISFLTESSYWLLGFNLPLTLTYIFLFFYTLTVDIYFSCVYGTLYL